MEKGSSEIRSAIEELSMMVNAKQGTSVVDHDATYIPTKPFLFLCNLVVQVLDKIGPTMAVLRQDIHQNIQRLEQLYESEPLKFSNLVEMLKKETLEGTARKSNSCSKGFVWLTRSMDFMAALLQKIAKEPGQSIEQAVEESYIITLKPWHGWISSAAYKVALKLVPDKKTFTEVLMAKGENYEALREEIMTLISLLVPFLEDIHTALRFYGLDRLKST